MPVVLVHLVNSDEEIISDSEPEQEQEQEPEEEQEPEDEDEQEEPAQEPAPSLEESVNQILQRLTNRGVVPTAAGVMKELLMEKHVAGDGQEIKLLKLMEELVRRG